MVEFAFTDEQVLLRTGVEKFCASAFSEAAVRDTMVSDPPFDQAVWARMGHELGVLGLAVPEAYGGGGTLVDLAIAVEQLGARLASGPLLGTVFLTIPALCEADPGVHRDNWLTALVSGSRTAAFAVPERDGVFARDDVTVTVSAGRLTGTAQRVVDAGAADILVVAARGADGVGLYGVDVDVDADADAGVARRSVGSLDLTRPLCDLTFSDTHAHLLAGPADATRVIGRAFLVGSALLAVEQVGASQHLLDLCVEHATTRRQFGRPIGSFQAVKHRLANLLVEVEHARSAAYHAVWALTDGSDDPVVATSIAQAVCSVAFSHAATDTIQVHGGIGFTWEHQAHLYLKRAVADAALLGSPESHRSRIAGIVIDASTTDGLPRVAEGISP